MADDEIRRADDEIREIAALLERLEDAASIGKGCNCPACERLRHHGLPRVRYLVRRLRLLVQS